MAGTVAGGKAAAATNKRLYGDGFYARIGALGGKKGKTGGNLEADHIKPYSLFPELRYEVDNGRTLCVDCHKKTPTWGKKILTYKKQLMIGERY